MVLVPYSFLLCLSEVGATGCGCSGLLNAIERCFCGGAWMLWVVMWMGVWMEAGWRGVGRLVGDVVVGW